ncbi:hypothetical protein Rhopal_000793-T1 [Rhodotorula paludigena]|uniref:Major facilitator superfamily (MFS) profile domain-containing protein n=1 Tax=Rhodotorula paludigena TaxID=86838 RepID=A0AAV5GCL9_9BASI|nr:hypothetical protein Rhopal_000793-T1 [Rhodotorula paludigena]
MAGTTTLETQLAKLDASAPVLGARSASEADDRIAQRTVQHDLGTGIEAVESAKASTVDTSKDLGAAHGAGAEPTKPADTHVIPKNKMWIVMSGLALTTFLAALDQTIVSTALSTIQRELDGTAASLSWVSGAYLLCITALAPCYGKLSDYFGRKPILLGSIVVFMLGSALCGSAKNMIWLCAARGVQGLGGGGILQLCNIVVADITPLATRGKWSGVIGATWGISAVLAVFLHLNPTTPPKAAHLLATCDFLGLFLLIAGLVVLLIGFTFGEQDWSYAGTIACLVIGVVVLGAAVFVEQRTKRSPIIPPKLFRTRNSAALLSGVFFQAFGFISLSYYEPLYFQALGASPLMSGVWMMPFSVGTAIFGIAAGFIVVKIKRTKEMITGAYLLSALGFALLATLDESSNTAKQILYLLVASIGIGPLFQLPMLHIQASMPQKDMATSTATLALLRSVGGTVGISVAGAIYASELKKGLGSIDGYGGAPSAGGHGEAAVGAVQGLMDIEPTDVRQQVLHAYSRALNFPWIICAPLLFVGFVISWVGLKHHSLDRTTVKAGKEEKAADGVEDRMEGAEREKAEETKV